MLRTLRHKDRGEGVEAWELFLRGLKSNSEVVLDEYFGTTTLRETKEFQKKNGLSPDGVVGRMTYGVAFKYGFDPLADASDDKNGPNWPADPGIVKLDYMGRLKTFGQFSFVPAPTKWNPEAIKITDGWSKENIVKAHIPQLVGINGAPKSGNIYLHRKCADQFVDTFAGWEKAGLKHLVISYAGSWVPRFIRGSRKSLSNHAWGTAIDINAPWNGLGAQPALVGKKGSVRELVHIAADNGLYWGGWYKRRPDGMHFEVAQVK
jgi:hypothetical protein